MKSHPSAEEIYEQIVKKIPTISKATVYRNLTLLSDEGKILKISVPNAPDRFDFNIDEHYHFRCNKCGKVFDIDGPKIDLSSFSNDSCHEIDGYTLIFSGTCVVCK